MLLQNNTKATYPFRLYVYKSGCQILIVPIIDHIAGYSVTALDYFCVGETDEAKIIGITIVKALKYVSESPICALNRKELDEKAFWKRASKYKSFSTFWKNNHYARIRYYEDGKIELYSLFRSNKTKGVYDGTIKQILFEENEYINESEENIEEKLGQALLDVLKASEEYYADLKVSKKTTRKEIELLDGSKLTYMVPSEKTWEDSEDCGAAEIYQSYSYIKKGDEDVAIMMFSIASELDCDISEVNIRNVWTELYGEPEYFECKKMDAGLFEIRSECRNKEIHKISYYKKQSDDLILECSLEVYNPNKRKKTEEKLLSEFKDFVKSVVTKND